MKYSYKIDKKANRSISKQTIVSSSKVDNDYFSTGKLNLYDNIQKKIHTKY